MEAAPAELSPAQATPRREEPASCPGRAWITIQSWHRDADDCIFGQFESHSKDIRNCVQPLLRGRGCPLGLVVQAALMWSG